MYPTCFKSSFDFFFQNKFQISFYMISLIILCVFKSFTSYDRSNEIWFNGGGGCAMCIVQALGVEYDKHSKFFAIIFYIVYIKYSQF